jgi:hypothetical protein
MLVSRFSIALAVCCTLPTIAIAFALPRIQALQGFALLLAVIAAIYIGFALADGRPSILAQELPVAACFLLITVLGLWVSPLFLVLGYVGHGLWDGMHHPKGITTQLPLWYPLFCLLYDWLIALCIIVRFSYLP